jgi:hypothetical protein
MSARFARLAAAAWLALAAWSGAVWGAGIELRDFRFVPGEEAYELSLNADFELPPALENLLEKGVTLTFRAEVEVQRPRWWWLNERVARRGQNIRLSYQTLTRQYRVSTGALQTSYTSLPEALRKITRLRQWPVVERRELKAGAQYEAVFRFYHDVSQLPKPLQVTAFATSEWELAAPPKTWTFVPEAR